MSFATLKNAIGVVRSFQRTNPGKLVMSTTKWGHICIAHSVPIGDANTELNRFFGGKFADENVLKIKQSSIASSKAALRTTLADCGMSDSDVDTVVPTGHRGRRVVVANVSDDSGLDSFLGIAPATDAPATDAPATDAPATDAPATDAPATDASLSQAKIKANRRK